MKIMNEARFDALAYEMDLFSCSSICSLIAEAQTYGKIVMLVMPPQKNFCH